MIGAVLVLLSVFWFASRYPQLFSKAEHVGQALPSMAYSSQVMSVATDTPIWLRILAATVNWLDSMKIGMSFGVLFGALLHTASAILVSRSSSSPNVAAARDGQRWDWRNVDGELVVDLPRSTTHGK